MPVFARRYDIRTRLGAGGNGVVWEAYDLNQGQVVALKLFRPGLPPALAFREAHQLTAFGGPHVLRVLNADIYYDVPYIATEVARAGSAMDRLANTLGVGTDLAIRWTRHLLSGLDACHRANVLHRDVKPGNLFLQSEDLAQLGDFGFAERMVAGAVSAAGTRLFFPPEAITSGRMTVHADIYATGLTLWMLLTGRHPFADAPSPAELDARIQRGAPRLRDVAPHVPNRVARVVDRSVAVDPAGRYETAQEMNEALGALPPVERLWLQHPPGSGETARWQSTARPGERHGYTVVVRPTGRRVAIETRHSGGAQHRVNALCFDAVPLRSLPARLRRVFDGLA